MIIIGIDPGLTGAFAVLGHRGECRALEDLPVMNRQGASAYVKNQIDPATFEAMLRDAIGSADRNEVHVFIEMPLAIPGQHSAVTASTFLTAGLIEGVVAARHYAHTLVAPSAWKKAVGLSSGRGMKKAEKKDMARSRAIRLFPDAPLSRTKDHNRAEALLIAKYGFDLIA